MKYVSGCPFTEAEREALERLKARVMHREFKRRRSAPSQNYNIAPTPASKARDARMMGEAVDKGPDPSHSVTNHTASKSSR